MRQRWSRYLSFLLEHRRLLAFGFAMTFFSSFGQTFFVSISNDSIQASLGIGAGKLGTIYSLATLASGLCLIQIGRGIDLLPLRRFSAAVAIALVIACTLLSQARHVLMLGGAFFLLRLAGQGLMSHIAVTTMARSFHANRGKALSVASLGYPAGEALLPLAGTTLIAAIGWQSSWLVIAGVGLLMVPTILWLLRGYHDVHTDAEAPAHEPSEALPRQWTRGEVLRDARFYLLLPCLMAAPFIVTGFFWYQHELVAAKGWTKTWFASCFIGFAATQLPTSILAGPLVDRLRAVRILPFALIPLGFGLVTLALSRHPMTALVFMLFIGVTSGLLGTVFGALWAELYGVAHLGAIRAMASAVTVIATAGSPASMGWMIEGGVTLESIALGSTLAVGAASVLAMFALRRRAISAPT